MSHLQDKSQKQITTVIFYIILAVIAIWLFVKYLLSPLLPFILAWLLAMLLQPVIDRACKRSRLKRKVISFILVFMIITMIIAGIYFISAKIISEMREIFIDLSADINEILSDIFGFFESLSSKLSINEESMQNADRIKSAIREFANSSISEMSSRIPSKIMTFVSSLPSMLFFVLAFIIASFYMSIDIRKVNAFFCGMLPCGIKTKLKAAKDKMLKDGLSYIRAYFIIMAITFLQLFVGFLLLKIPYALTLAIVIAFVDILPILGVGTVLIPWACILFIRHNNYLGIGLIIVFAIIYISRQIIEPKIISVSIGTSPLVMLVSMYVGIKLIGAGGIFVFPIAVIFFKNLVDCGIFKRNEAQDHISQDSHKNKAT